MGLLRKQFLYYALVICIILCIFCSLTVTGVMISSPNVVKPGEHMSVYIGNLNTRDSLQVDVVGEIKVTAGEDFFFQMNRFNTGISCDSPNLEVMISDLVDGSSVTMNITYQDGTSIEKTKLVENGNWNQIISETKFPAGDYDISISGTAAQTQVPLDLTFTGIADQRELLNELTMRIYGISNGVFEIDTKVNGELAESKSFTIQDQLIAY